MKTRTSISNKLLLSAAAVTTVVGLAGVGTLAGWSKTVSDSHTVTAGTFDLTAVSAGADASNFVPGDSTQRLLTVSHAGDVDYASLELTTTVPAGDALDNLVASADPNSLRIAIDRCPVAWTPSGATFTCAGPIDPVEAGTAVLGTWTLTGSPALRSALGVDNLRVTISLPSANTNYTDFNGEDAAINYAVTATQRAGQAK